MKEKHQQQLLDIFMDLKRSASNKNTLCQVAKSFVHEVRCDPPAVACFIAKLTSHANLEVIGSYGYHSPFFEVGKKISVWDSWAVCQAVRESRVVYIQSNAEYQELYPENASVAAPGEGFIAFPLVRRSEVIGVIGISFSRELSEFCREPLLAEGIGLFGGLLIEPLADSQVSLSVIKSSTLRDLASATQLESLTDRQREILFFLSEGATYKQISIELMLSESLIKKDASRAFQIIGVHTRSEASRWAKTMQLEA
jgi:DNA-binding CsgD family transcriptional regulator